MLASILTKLLYSCYTNHALDQFLEHLVQSGIEKVIRIGGQSKSEILEGKNLRIVSRSETTTGPEGRTLGITHSAVKREEKLVETLLRQLNGLNGYPIWKSLKNYVARHHYQIYRQFDRFDEEGFETVRAPFSFKFLIFLDSFIFPSCYLNPHVLRYFILMIVTRSGESLLIYGSNIIQRWKGKHQPFRKNIRWMT